MGQLFIISFTVTVVLLGAFLRVSAQYRHSLARASAYRGLWREYLRLGSEQSDDGMREVNIGDLSREELEDMDIVL